MKHFLVALFLAVALYGSFMIFQYRDIVFYWDFAKPVGSLALEQNETLKKAMEAYLAANRTESPSVCVTKWFGRDDLFIYAKVLCDEFSQENGKATRANRGEYLAARFEYDPTTNIVQGLETAIPGEFGSMRSLFPKQIYSLMRVEMEPSQALLEEGLTKQGEADSAIED